MTSSRHAGFTLLELCLAMLIAVLIIVVAVPSISGLLAEQRLRESFARFDHLAAVARQESVTGQHECRLVWDRKGITLQRAMPEGDAGAAGDERLVFAKDESFALRRTAALQKNAPDEWTFWRNGTCEPVQIAFQGASGSWLVSYDALTAHATFLRSSVP